MKKEPLFSVVIPAYNCARFIQQTLRSVYEQTERDFEIIVVNDGSSDNLLEILAQEDDSRLRIINQKNGGVSRARNKGIQEARGKYIAFLDSDDAWLPCHLEKARVFFEKYPEYFWYATKPIKVDAIEESDLQMNVPDKCDYYVSNWFLEFAILPLCSQAVLNSEKAKKYLHFPEDVKMFEDNVAWSYFAINAGNIGTIEYSTSLYRQWNCSASQIYRDQRMISDISYGSEALLIQQKILKEEKCSLEARLYFRKRSLCNWIAHINRLNISQWRQVIRERQYVTGKCISKLLYLYAWGGHVATKLLTKLISKQADRIQRKLDQMLFLVKRKLN